MFPCCFKTSGQLSPGQSLEVSCPPSGTAPTRRARHTAVWSDVADGMYVFAGVGFGRGLSVNGPPCGTRRSTPRLGWGKLFNDLPLLWPPGAGRMEFCWRCFLEEFLGYCLAGLMRSHVGIRACMQCTCRHGQICPSLNPIGGCRMWVLCFLGLHCWRYGSGLRLEYIWDSAVRFDLSPWKLLLPTFWNKMEWSKSQTHWMAFRQQHAFWSRSKWNWTLQPKICKTGFNIQLSIWTLSTACEMRRHGSNLMQVPRLCFMRLNASQPILRTKGEVRKLEKQEFG